MARIAQYDWLDQSFSKKYYPQLGTVALFLSLFVFSIGKQWTVPVVETLRKKKILFHKHSAEKLTISGGTIYLYLPDIWILPCDM